MHTRPVTHADIPSIVDGSAAFLDAELNVWLYPRRREFPECWRARIVRALRASLAKPGIHSFVCVTDHEDPADWPRGKIIGYSRWEWNGLEDDPRTLKWRSNNTGVAKAVERTLVDWENRYVDYFHLDKALHRERKAVFDKENLESGNPYAPLESFWNLLTLNTHPDWQGKGVGKKLMEWGLERSRENEAPIILIATTAGQRLYNKLGFFIVGWAANESMAWAEGGAIMILDINEKYTRKAIGAETKKEYFSKVKEIEVVYE
ncbi:hypothetical protein K4K60_005579 [Colletotrichum sp. SAR11_57]|nr:hypothetical protein K4K60_005579 [Colletotrichum sp. SAR11_57]